jgi:cytochrome b561
MQRYTRTAMFFHWTIALLIMAGFTLGLVMTDIPGITPTKLKYFSWHKWMGVTVLALAALRLLWRLRHAAPPYPDSMPKWQVSVADATHRLLYVLMFAVPLSGYFFTLASGVPVVYLGVLPLPVLIEPNPQLKPILREVHFWLNMGLAGLVGAHVAGALKHLIIERDGVTQRMLP